MVSSLLVEQLWTVLVKQLWMTYVSVRCFRRVALSENIRVWRFLKTSDLPPKTPTQSCNSMQPHLLALSYTVWFRQYDETASQLPWTLVQIRQRLE